MTMIGVITKGGQDVTCPSCGGSHQVTETLRYDAPHILPYELVVTRACVRCRLKQVTS